MSNPEHVEILKKGVDTWNAWRSENPNVVPDLSGENLFKFKHAEGGYVLSGEAFSEANFSGAKLGFTNFTICNLIGADFSKADLYNATFKEADLLGADFKGAQLTDTDFIGAMLGDANFTDAVMDRVRFGSSDFTVAKGLDKVIHRGPSVISIEELLLWGRDIPEVFLRGCGVPESFIVQIPALVAAMQPIQFYSCFISYSSKDEELAQRLHADLQARGVRCWFAPEDLKIGERFRRRIDEVIRVHDKLLLVLSAHSVASSWVEKEVETAMESENEQHRTVLFPVRLDDSVMGIKEGWPADVRRTRHIGDFRRWKEHDEYQKAFARLLSDLKASA